MSYILEALKKAEQERDIGAVPNLATPHEPRQPQARSYRWLGIILVLLSVNAVLLALLLQDREAELGATAQAPLERQPTRVNEAPAQPIRQASETTMSEGSIPENTVVPQSQRTPSAGELVVLPEPTSVQQTAPVLASVEMSDERVDAATTAQDTSQLPSWYELPAELRSRLDLPRLDLHAYSEEPQNRFILVKLKKYREGESLESGLVLEEILPEGMVMSYRGERFLVDK